METRASPFIVGLFTLGVLLGVLAFVFWIGRYGDIGGREEYQIVFHDEVTGLSAGSAVLLSGLRVGEVTSLSIAPDDPSRVVARVQIDGDVPLREDATAQLQYQGITGVGYIQLKGGSPSARTLAETWDQPGPPVIEARSSAFQDLMDGAEAVLTRLDSVAQRVDSLVASNERAVNATMQNVEAFTGALAENADGIESFMADAGSAARRIDSLGARLEGVTGKVDEVVTAVEPDSVRAIIADMERFSGRMDTVSERVATLVDENETALSNTIRNAETFSAALAENADGIESFMADAGAAARRLDSAGARIEGLAERVDEVVAVIEPDAVRAVMTDMESFAGRMDSVAQRVASLVEENEAAVGRTIANAETFSAALAENSEAMGTFMADAAEAARSLGAAGDNLDAMAGRMSEVAGAIEPDEVRAIVADARTFSTTLADNSEQISTFAQEAGSAAERLNRLAGGLEGVGEQVTSVMGAVDPDRVSRSLENVENFTTALAQRSGDFEQFMDDAGAVAAQLRQTSERLESVLARVDGMVGEDGDDVMTEVAAAARSFRELTENLDGRLGAIASDIERFGGGGLRDFQSFMSEGRRTLANIERVITNLERNPSQLLFGGSEQSEYNPGRRF